MRRSLRVNLPVRLRPTSSTPSSASSILIARNPQNRTVARHLPFADRFQTPARRCLHTTLPVRQEALAAEDPEIQSAGAAAPAKKKFATAYTDVIQEGRFLRLTHAATRARNRALDLLWLRDSCGCAQCLNPDSGQKTFSTTDLPDVPELKTASLDSEGNLTVVWQNDVLSNGQEHATTLTNQELERLIYNSGPRIQHHPPYQRLFWNKSTFEALRAEGECTISYQDWMTNDEAFWAAFTTLTKTGLLFVQGVPEDEREVEKIASRIGMIQHTFYGNTWDVKSKPQAENVAYTNVFLGLHQDLMYHVPIPRLQLLHCIANSSEGGESIFSDGLRAAAEIKNLHREAYDVLTKKEVEFGYEKGENHYQSSLPTISVDSLGAPLSTHWAPPFQTSFFSNEKSMLFKDKKHITLADWKKAATVFKSNVEDPKNVVEVKMQPGECVIFDNWRVLHGRNEFAVGGEGTRWLKGTYISPQVYQAKETALRRHAASGTGRWQMNTPQKRYKRWEREQTEWGKSSGLYEYSETKGTVKERVAKGKVEEGDPKQQNEEGGA
ncbi:hypothetical protein QBC44DRAFT_314493 [Cladorrhinum sp. PSN332]|nr:hypothetical protein QBC44DRAFT_314493 [Cladorrhinum sp. PSN332]